MTEDYDSEFTREEEAAEIRKITALFLDELAQNQDLVDKLVQSTRTRLPQGAESSLRVSTQWVLEFQRRLDFLLTVGLAALREDLQRQEKGGTEYALAMACCVSTAVISQQIDQGQFLPMVRDLITWVYDQQAADEHKPAWFQLRGNATT